MTKEDLLSVKRIADEIDKKSADVSAMELLAESLTAVMDGLPKGTTLKSRVEAIALKRVMIEREIEELRGRLALAKQRLTRLILDEVQGTTLQTVLIYRYVKLETWSQIAKAMNLDRRWLFRLNQKFATTCHCATP